MVDHELGIRLGTLFEEKAKAIGLEYNILLVTSQGTDTIDGMYDQGETLSVDFENKNVTIVAADTSPFTPEALEIVIENLACHCLNIKKGVYGRGTLVLSHDQYVQASAFELNRAHSSYFAGKTHIEKFGRSNYAKFQMRGLGDFVEDTRRWVGASTDKMEKQVFIFALFKEHMKSALLNDSSGLMPQVISDISEPFVECFEAISAAEGMSWAEKSIGIYAMMTYLSLAFDIPKSYKDGKMTRRNPKQRTDVSCIFAESGYIGGKQFKLCAQVEDIMNSSYES